MNWVWTTLPKGAQRRLARWCGRRRFPLRLTSPIVSFTFDDFPRSALVNGGRILRAHGFTGTYYVSFGLMGRTAPTGEIFQREDLTELIQQGHELACHTFDHCHSWETAPAEFEASIERNQRAAAELLPGHRMTTFSYPISHPRPQTKDRTARHYGCARGGGQTFNSGTVDLNYLNAFFLEQSRDDFAAIQRTMDANAQANGWLILATHDVCESPTRFGCTPGLFERVVAYAAGSGASVQPVGEACRRVTASVSAGQLVTQ